MRTRIALAVLAAAALTATAYAAQFVSLKTGIGYDRERFRLIRETQTVTVLDWPVYALVHYRNNRRGDQWDVRVTPPDNAFTWGRTFTARDAYSNYFIPLLLPIPGTSNEERTGTWTITVAHEGQQHSAQLQVTAASREILDSLRSARLDNFTAAYRLGVAASMFGEHELAVSALYRAASLAPRNPFPHVALCRHHLRAGQNEQARQSCAMARGLILGYEDKTITGWLASEIEALLRQAGE